MRKALAFMGICSLSIAGWIGQASANPIDDFGLIGTWAPDCSNPPSNQNVNLTFTSTSLLASAGFDFTSPIKEAVIPLTNPRSVSATKISYTLISKNREINPRSPNAASLTVVPDSTSNVVLEKGADGRIRVWQTHLMFNGTTFDSITDGYDKLGKRQAPWMEKCINR